MKKLLLLFLLALFLISCASNSDTTNQPESKPDPQTTDNQSESNLDPEPNPPTTLDETQADTFSDGYFKRVQPVINKKVDEIGLEIEGLYITQGFNLTKKEKSETGLHNVTYTLQYQPGQEIMFIDYLITLEEDFTLDSQKAKAPILDLFGLMEGAFTFPTIDLSNNFFAAIDESIALREKDAEEGVYMQEIDYTKVIHIIEGSDRNMSARIIIPINMLKTEDFDEWSSLIERLSQDFYISRSTGQKTTFNPDSPSELNITHTYSKAYPDKELSNRLVTSIKTKTDNYLDEAKRFIENLDTQLTSHSQNIIDLIQEKVDASQAQGLTKLELVELEDVTITISKRSNTDPLYLQLSYPVNENLNLITQP